MAFWNSILEPIDSQDAENYSHSSGCEHACHGRLGSGQALSMESCKDTQIPPSLRARREKRDLGEEAHSPLVTAGPPTTVAGQPTTVAVPERAKAKAKTKAIPPPPPPFAAGAAAGGAWRILVLSLLCSRPSSRTERFGLSGGETCNGLRPTWGHVSAEGSERGSFGQLRT